MFTMSICLSPIYPIPFSASTSPPSTLSFRCGPANQTSLVNQVTQNTASSALHVCMFPCFSYVTACYCMLWPQAMCLHFKADGSNGWFFSILSGSWEFWGIDSFHLSVISKHDAVFPRFPSLWMSTCYGSELLHQRCPGLQLLSSSGHCQLLW